MQRKTTTSVLGGSKVISKNPAIMEPLRASAVQLAAQHLEVVSAVKELCEAAVHDEEKGLGSSSATTQLLLPQGGSSSLSCATMATEGVWRAVAGCWDEGEVCHLLPSLQRRQLSAVLQTATSLVDSLLFLPHFFLQLVIEQLPRIPLEVVCGLHSANLLSLEAMLLGGPAVVQYVVSALVSVTCTDSRADGQDMVMQAMALVLSDLTWSKCAVALEVVQRLPAALLAQSSPTRYSLVQAAIDCPSITSSAAVELASTLLSSCLDHPPSSLLEAVPHQTQWQYCRLPDSVASLYSGLLSALGSSHFIQLVQKAMSVEQLNWPALLQAMACFIQCNDSAPDEIAVLVKELVSAGLEEGDTHLLSCGLLLARQASLEGAHLFPSYQCWLHTIFGDSAMSVVGGKKQLLFLLKTLTRFVPYDPPFALKAHISRPPHQVAKCLVQLNDYISLASTRLKDLGEKVPTTGGEEVECDANKDVAEAIAYYNQHLRISQPVMEASIFRSPYFVGRFLRSLLSPSPSLVGHEGREALITALVREKKIPQRMLKNYEKACQELRSRGSPTSPIPPLVPGSVACVLRELPHIVMEAKGVNRLLSQLSATLHEEISDHPSHTLTFSTVKLVDDILSAVCETVILLEGKADASYRWLGDLLTMLSSHTALHQPVYLRLTELLTTQLPDLTGFQLCGLAVLLCEALCLSPHMAAVMERQNSLSTGELCASLLSGLRHDTPICMAQSLRFGCMFVHHLMSCDSSGHLVPSCLLHKMAYMYGREMFLQTHTTNVHPSSHIHRQEAVQAVDTLLLEYPAFAEQWQGCKVGVEEWLSWELDVNPAEDAMSKYRRQSYRLNVVFSCYLQTCSVLKLFMTLFKALANCSSSDTEFLAILQELSHMLPVQGQNKPSSLLRALEDVLCVSPGCSLDADSGEKARECMTLASCLPPHLLFANCPGQPVPVQLVADFIQYTLAPVVEDMMVLPPHITLYLTLGATAMAGDTLSQLCDTCSTYLASAMAHWSLLPGGVPCSAELEATASWIHSGIRSPFTYSAGSLLLASLGVALTHFFTHYDDTATILQQLTHVPVQVVVIVAVCCVHWLAPQTNPHPLGSTVEAILQACLQQEPSAVEVLCSSQLPPGVQLKHSEVLISFKSIFSCKPSAFYPTLLLRLLPRLPNTMLRSLMTEPCFLWLCVSAHTHCLSLCTPLPFRPPLSYKPLSVEFIQDSNAAIKTLIQLADHSQLQSVLDQCHCQLQSFITSKLQL